MRVGDRVKLNPEIERFYYGRGHAVYDEIGIVVDKNSVSLIIDFPSHEGWKGKANELIKVRREVSEMEEVICKDCGKKLTKEEIENEDYYELDDGIICRDCYYEENYFTCEDCGEVYHRDDGYWVKNEGKIVCTDCLDDNYFQCDDCGEYYHNDNRVYISGRGTYICEECRDSGDYYYCDDCGYCCHADDIHFIDDNCYCDECYDEHCEDKLYDYHEFQDWQLFKGKNEENPKYYIGKEIELEPTRHSNVSGVLEAIKNNINAVGMHDGSLENGGVEVVTHPESWQYLQENKEDYIKFFDEIENLDYGDDGGCGLHFHVSRPSDEITSRVIVLLESFKEEIKILSRRNGDFHWSKFFTDGLSDSDKVKYQSTKWLKDKYVKDWHDRYYALNLQNSKTIEFRFFNGVNNFEEYWAALQFIHNIMELAYDENRELNTIKWKELLVGDELQSQAKKLGVLDIDKNAKDTTDILEKYEASLRKAKEEIRGILRNLAKYVNKEISELDITQVRTNDIDKIMNNISEFTNKIYRRREYLEKIMDLYRALNEDNSIQMESIKDYMERTKLQYPVNSDRYKRYNKLIEKAIKKYESEVR